MRVCQNSGTPSFLTLLCTVNYALCIEKVGPWGVEPQSKEPESFILSIELWARDTLFCKMRCKSSEYFVSLQK